MRPFLQVVLRHWCFQDPGPTPDVWVGRCSSDSLHRLYTCQWLSCDAFGFREAPVVAIQLEVVTKDQRSLIVWLWVLKSSSFQNLFEAIARKKYASHKTAGSYTKKMQVDVALVEEEQQIWLTQVDTEEIGSLSIFTYFHTIKWYKMDNLAMLQMGKPQPAWSRPWDEVFNQFTNGAMANRLDIHCPRPKEFTKLRFFHGQLMSIADLGSRTRGRAWPEILQQIEGGKLAVSAVSPKHCT